MLLYFLVQMSRLIWTLVEHMCSKSPLSLGTSSILGGWGAFFSFQKQKNMHKLDCFLGLLRPAVSFPSFVASIDREMHLNA